MDGRSFFLGSSGNRANPLAQALALLVFALVVIGAVVIGSFVLVTLVGLGVIAFVALKVRAWWLRRRGRRPNGGPGPGRPAKGIRYIEGEYEVIDVDADAERRRSGKHR